MGIMLLFMRRLDVYLCGSVHVYLCGSVDVYLCGIVLVYLCGSVDVYLYVDVQICGCIRSPIICGCVDVVVVVADRLFIAIFHSIDFTLSKLLIQISPHSGTLHHHPHPHHHPHHYFHIS